MQHLFQSTFLQALGFAIANSLWQTALVWLIFMCVNSLSLSSAVKYRFAVAAQFTGFIWFIITLQFYYTRYSEVWRLADNLTDPQLIQAISPPNDNLSSQLINWMVKTEQLFPYLSVAYLLLLLFLCIRWFLGYRHTQGIRNNGLQKIPGNWRVFVKRIAAQLGIKKEIRLFLSETVSTPMTIGFLKPIILIPVASINHLTTDQLEAVILHELAHIKRYDYLVNIILSVVEIGLFFNPFTQLLSKSIRKERENSCDDWVLQFQYNASVYAEALLRIAYLQSVSVPAFAMAATSKKNDLLARVKRMIDKKDNRFNYRKQLLAFVIVTGMLSSVAWLNPLTSPEKKTSTTFKNVPVLQKKIPALPVKQITLKADNPLFNPVSLLSEPFKSEIKKGIEAARKEMEIYTHPGTQEHKELIASIPPIVADALEQASLEMTDKNVILEKEMAKMDFARMNLEKVFRFDSATLLKNFGIPFKADFEKSMKSIENDIAKAKIEMAKAWKVQAAIKIDGEKIRNDIQKAMVALNKIKLDKLVNDALQVPGLRFGENNQRRQKTKTAPKANNPQMRRPVLAFEIQPEETQPAEEKTASEDGEAETPYVNPLVVTELVRLLHTENNIEMDFSTINRIQYIIRHLEALHVQSRAIPVVYKERKIAVKRKKVIQL